MTIDTDCTEPAPSAGVSEERVRNIRAWNAARAGSLSGADTTVAICDELLSARSRIAELSRQLEQAEAVRSDEAFGGALSDELYKTRIAELEAGIRKWASECGECEGTGKVATSPAGDDFGGYMESCDQCADIRALLPKEST